MQYLKTKILLSTLVFLPAVTYAENITDLKSLINYIRDTMNALIPPLFGLAFIAFIWGIIKYIYSTNTKDIGDARNYMIFGIIAIAVMLSVWGLAFAVKNTFFGGTPATFTPSESRDPSPYQFPYERP